ncbi:MAG TPA: leucine--tRNA ligase [Candidatus Nanoarchaeia archaeon]|nr:leucine--tRNA ligase [Candidatus Nanoarchaeia archaeon]
MKKEFSFKAIEQKWRKKWEEEKIFEATPDKRKKFFINFPYPYINGYFHLGHAFSITRVDVAARYKRMNGYNVLFPQAWHCTGTPVWAAAQRIREKEEKQIQIMKSMGFSGKEISKFGEVKHWIDTFVPAAQEDLSRLGESIDWRRSFITTDLNPRYDAFIRWQFNKLKEKGYVVKGKRPTVWCPKDQMVVGDHDRSEGEGETTQDFIWIKFRAKDSDLVLMAGTTRPDALYGQTNLWIDPEGEYVVVRVLEEQWVVGKNAVDKIKNQYSEDASVIRSISPKELIGIWVRGPLVERDIHVLPASFIQSDVGSGIVYSALEDPVDLFELKKIQSDSSYIRKFGLDSKEVMRLKPIDIIQVEGLGNNLGESIAKEFGITSSKDVVLLEKAKSELNKRVFRKGVMKKICGQCAGMSVSKAQVFLKDHLVSEKQAVMFYELSGKIVCRCLTPSVVKIVSDQWFLKYGDGAWKELARKTLASMKLHPELVRQQFDYVLGWLNDWACTHRHGTGTRLPWDETWVIESLSDSTIYMAYYTIAHLIKDYPKEKVNDSFFDYVFFGKGNGDARMQKMRKEFDYWYPFDVRSSGKDLVQNHLSFCLFNHAAIFPEKHWPKSFSVNGWLLVEGEKMSKSKGNFFSIREVLEKYSADSIRAGLMLGGEGLDDPNFGFSNVETVIQKLKTFFDFVQLHYNKSAKKSMGRSELLLLSAVNRYLKEGIEAMEQMLFRTAFDTLFFQFQRVLKEYMNRGQINQAVLNSCIELQIRVLSPFCPHIAEELWSSIGNNSFVSLASWPQADESLINDALEESERAIDRGIKDVLNLLALLQEKQGKSCEKVYLYVVPHEVEGYNPTLLGRRVGKEVIVFAVNDPKKYDPQGKSGKVKPGRPGIYLE